CVVDPADDVVDPEGFVGEGAHAADLVAKVVRVSPQRADDAESTSVADRCHELGAGVGGHPGLDDGDLDAEDVAGGGLQAADAAHALVDLIANTQSPVPVTHPHSISSTSHSFA